MDIRCFILGIVVGAAFMMPVIEIKLGRRQKKFRAESAKENQ